jgi:hypothetical protein
MPSQRTRPVNRFYFYRKKIRTLASPWLQTSSLSGRSSATRGAATISRVPDPLFHSVRKLFTGLASAALTALYPTVIQAITIEKLIATAKTPQPNEI